MFNTSYYNNNKECQGEYSRGSIRKIQWNEILIILRYFTNEAFRQLTIKYRLRKNLRRRNLLNKSNVSRRKNMQLIALEN